MLIVETDKLQNRYLSGLSIFVSSTLQSALEPNSAKDIINHK